MITFLSILCVVLIIYIIGSIVSFLYRFDELTSEIIVDNNNLGIIFTLLAFLMALFAGVFWPMIIYNKIEEFFKKDKTNV